MLLPDFLGRLLKRPRLVSSEEVGIRSVEKRRPAGGTRTVGPHFPSSCHLSCQLSSTFIIMSRRPKFPRFTLEQDIPLQVEVPDTLTSSSSSQSPPQSPPRTPTQSPFSCSSLSTSHEGVDVLHTPQTLYSSPSSSSVFDENSSIPEEETSESTSSGSTDENSSILEEETSESTLSGSTDTVFLPRVPLEKKATELVHFLLCKYQMREPITKADILDTVIKNYESHFTVIMEKASKCIEMVFGIEVKEMDPDIQSYEFVNLLDLTYDENPSDEQKLPKNGLLILVLGLIFLEDNCASEDKIWEFLNTIKVFAEKDHFIYGDSRQLLTRDWVQENYLVYRPVPNSDPPCHEFLWGPRAHAETSKMKVLQFFAKVTGNDLSSFSPWYEEALEDEKEKLQARIVPVDNSTIDPSPTDSSAPISSPES
ncbi:PREDICTED: melanoma-associated antigen 10-like [Elephantulus edwardii]|uniref:melanoma-associated antigen 10-like n=1 Tax=Elephantulus edwardii TaxID=28737 RepID=UPI0003F06621|nr:PREDICTED: melanoma-associated antigen 10-like [Elephantulus edwardii]